MWNDLNLIVAGVLPPLVGSGLVIAFIFCVTWDWQHKDGDD